MSVAVTVSSITVSVATIQDKAFHVHTCRYT